MKMGIEEIKAGRIDALYKIGVDSISKLLTTSIEEMAKGDRVGMKNATKIWDNIHVAIVAAPLAKVMSGSGVFGPGFADVRLNAIVDAYPDILEYAHAPPGTVTSLLREIGGFDKNAVIFEDLLPEFVDWLADHPQITIGQPRVIEEKAAELPLEGINISFTGVSLASAEGKALKQKIESLGGTVKTSFSNLVNLLVARDPNNMQGKGQKAIARGVEIISLAQFKEQYP